MIFFMRCFLILLALLICKEGLYADNPSSCRIAAVVNKSIISHTDLMNRLRFATISSGLEPSAENLEKMKSQMLRVMIDEQLQLQTGEKYGITIDKEHLQAAIRDIEETNGLPGGALSKMMEENNIPLKTFENQIKAQLVWLIFIREKYPLKTLEDQ